MTAGGCITRRWTQTLDVSDQVVDLISREPELVRAFERLHDDHGQRLPRLMGWNSTLLTRAKLDARRIAHMLTSCTRTRGLQSSCWVTTTRRSER